MKKNISKKQQISNKMFGFWMLSENQVDLSILVLNCLKLGYIPENVFNGRLKIWTQIIKRKYDNTCCICGLQRLKYMHAHHIHPIISHPIYRLSFDNGVVLCPSCHSKLHNNKLDKEVTDKYLITNFIIEDVLLNNKNILLVMKKYFEDIDSGKIIWSLN